MRQNNTLSIIGLVIGIISLLISFIPCIGALGAIPGIIGLILGYMGYRECKAEDISTTIAIIALVTSGLSVLLGGGQWIFLSNAGGNAMEAVSVTYESCDDLMADWEKTTARMEELTKNAENESGFSMIKEVINITTKIGAIRAKSEEMECTADSTFNAKFEEGARRIENIDK